MYVPEPFEEPRIEVMYALIRNRPLATLVTLGPAGVEANHIPLALIDQAGTFGSLRRHVARANPLWQNHAQDAEVLAIFHGPESYITPSWYASKAEEGKVVPTWTLSKSTHGDGCVSSTTHAGFVRNWKF